MDLGMYYTIYRITNQINGKCYVGKHQTKDLNDGYMGSGKLIKRAIVKYGIENFSKEILHVFNTEKEMNAKEAEIVTEDFCKNSYNLCKGGQGGFGFINSNPDQFLTEKRLKSLERGKLFAKEGLRKWLSTEEGKRQRSEYSRRAGLASNGFKGKLHSQYSKCLMSEKAKLRRSDQNSQFGTMWITDGSLNKKISKDAQIPVGWKKGRKIG
jgi:hypothetical protein